MKRVMDPWHDKVLRENKEVDSRDKVMHDGKNDLILSDEETVGPARGTTDKKRVERGG